jgi:hypothetical protein
VGLRLVVTGSREGRPDVWYWLDRWVAKYGAPELVILGDARGVDAQAQAWCEARDYNGIEFLATWRKHYNAKGGDMGGTLRNIDMVNAARRGDWCVGFPRPKSRGTWQCLGYAARQRLHAYACPMKEAA